MSDDKITADALERQLRSSVAEKIRVTKQDDGRFRVLTPFMFEDGDHLVIVLKLESEKWLLSDDGHTYMHLSYDISELAEERGRRLSDWLSAFFVRERNGELFYEVNNSDFGEAVFNFVQAITQFSTAYGIEGEVLGIPLAKIDGPSVLVPETMEFGLPAEIATGAAFRRTLGKTIQEVAPPTKITTKWFAPRKDFERKYRVDWRIETSKSPLFVYGLWNDGHVRDATISLHQFREWRLKFEPVGVFATTAKIGNRVRSRFEDVCETRFEHFESDRARLERFLKKAAA